jgi:hypothetical protein
LRVPVAHDVVDPRRLIGDEGIRLRLHSVLDAVDAYLDAG